MTFKRISAVFISALLCICQLSCATEAVGSNDFETVSENQKNSLSFRITWKDYSGRGQAIQTIVEKYNLLSGEDASIQMISGD